MSTDEEENWTQGALCLGPYETNCLMDRNSFIQTIAIHERKNDKKTYPACHHSS